MYYFDWDENKNRINLEKHGITFEEASTVFFDDRAILFDDPEHSIDEDRFLLLGMSETAKVCIVCHCYRESDTVIRIISARQATRKEEQRYVRRNRDMLEEYDIDKLNPRPNPYAKELKKQITIKISPSVIDYFKSESMETGIPYQTLINLYLVDCVKSKRKLEIAWK